MTAPNMRTYNSLKIRRNNFIGCGKMVDPMGF
nr:MAG TPA: hypothetical protein [Caudoviricetes sp.]